MMSGRLQQRFGLRFALPVAIVAMLLLSAAAQAQVGAASPAHDGRGPGHGWVSLPGDDDGHTLWHLPPRLSSAEVEGAPSGTLRLVLRLAERPEQMAAWGSSVWLITPPRRAGSEASPLRRVYRLSVRSSPVGSAWQYDDAGRLRTERPLPGGDRLIAAAGSRAGPCALMQAPGEPPRLLRLERDGWIELDLPEAVAAAAAGQGAAVGLAALSDGLGVWAQDGSALTLWRGIDAEPAVDDDTDSAAQEEGEWSGDEPAAMAAQQMQWTSSPLAGTVDAAAEAKLWSVGGRIIATEWAGRTTLRALDLSGDRPVTLAEMDGVDPAAAACALDGSRRIAIVWREAEAGEAKPWNPRRIIEISTDDGSVMFDGQAQTPGPVSPAEVKLLAIALVMIAAGALVFIVRSDDGRHPIALPDGTALAPARFRVAAGIIDGSLAWLIAGAILGDGAARSLEINLGGASMDFAPLLATLLVGWMLGAGAEWLTGRSLGKWMAGCAVVSVRPGDQRPGLMRAPRLWQALVRNFVKFPLAPIAMLGLASPELRHRGDALSQTAVVIPVVEEGEG